MGMGNVLSDDKKQQVVALGRLGWSLRRIEEATAVRRETVSGSVRSAMRRPPQLGQILCLRLSRYTADRKDTLVRERRTRLTTLPIDPLLASIDPDALGNASSLAVACSGVLSAATRPGLLPPKLHAAAVRVGGTARSRVR